MYATTRKSPLRRRITWLIGAVTVLISLSTFLTAPPASAAAYTYLVGHPMYFGAPNTASNGCTGGYAVRGASGMFVVTAGHCAPNHSIVFGRTERFGRIIRNDFAPLTPSWFDGALVQLDPDDDALQIVENPLGGQRPGSGRVRGWYANSALTQGFVIGKMGDTTGWTEGFITGWQSIEFDDGSRDYLLCTTALAGEGDSGGPVWRNDQNGVMAIGIVIASVNLRMCFNPIENVLNRFGAWLPVYTSGRSTHVDQSASAATVIREPNGPPLPINLTPVRAQRL